MTEDRGRVASVYVCAYNDDTTYEWDVAKAESNRRKHGVEFADAVGVLEDPLALTIEDTETEEERCVTIGMDFLGRLLVVVWAERGGRFRIISARRATKSERKQYEDEP